MYFGKLINHLNHACHTYINIHTYTNTQRERRREEPFLLVKKKNTLLKTQSVRFLICHAL
jgi:hypothetical protein